MAMDPTQLDAAGLASAYRSGELRPTLVVEAYLERAQASAAYRVVTAERARRQARRAERQLAAGIDVGPLLGVPIAIKDLFDMEGEVTAAGSRALAQRPPALADAPAVARLDAAGAVFLGRTQMTELAFSGLGLNPHFGTPGNALDPELVPGGSSAGSAVAVAERSACLALGSDTGGSVRIPAAFNRLVGLKPSDGAIPGDGMVPLSFTLDTVGPLARSVSDAWLLYRALAALPPERLAPPPRRLSLFAPETVLGDSLAPEVAQAFGAALERLESQGHEVTRGEFGLFAEMAEESARRGGLAAHEALALHEDLLEERGDQIDPRVKARILAARGRPATDYVRLLLARRRWQSRAWEELGRFDAVLAPTVPILPPRLRELERDDAYFEANRLCLRNTSLFNMLGGPAVSVPCGTGMTGLMVATAPRSESLALAIAGLLEPA